MGKPISDIVVWKTLPFTYVTGEQSQAVSALVNAYPTFFTSYPTGNTSLSVQGFNSKDSLFFKRIRVNSTFKLFANIDIQEVYPISLSCLDNSLTPPTSEQFILELLTAPYEWQDINMFIPIEQGTSGIARPNIVTPLCHGVYNADAIYNGYLDNVAFELECVHNLPLVLA